ncbi:hypothetical protein MKEN_00188800 [Mycena kentingensis (nom. inval.)]|nr:hypothetical protein MKEN_00188800 [Mycena kentingensis (nom. inval.)]
MLYVILSHWWKLPLYVALIYLGKTRISLQRNNLYDTYREGELPPQSCDGVNLAARTLSGICNNLDTPAMGARDTRFGRYVPLEETFAETSASGLFEPNARRISQEILKRKEFVPAKSINMLAAAWIQFQVHDWFMHEPKNDPNNLVTFPLPANDPLLLTGQQNMTFRSTLAEAHADNRPNTFINKNTHWWDLSQVYGQDDATHAKMRAYVDGKLVLADDGLLRVGEDGIDISGFTENWWAGLSVMHNLWAKEHNAISEMFKEKYPDWSDQEIFDHARLVTSALNAKIHTVEWTTAMLQNPILEKTLNANWYGLGPEWLQDLIPQQFLGHTLDQQISEVWYGIIGGKPDFAGVAFAHAEEFVAVYRFHSLLPDNITIRSHAEGGKQTDKVYHLLQYVFAGTRDVVHGSDFADVVYTFGADYPGALKRCSRCMHEPGAPFTLDMGAVDIMRDRERGVPRYNEFRRLFSLIPAKRMEDISDDPAAVKALRSVYGNDVEAVDLLTGCLAESPRATGFAFSNTAFQVFILAASRRLMTDRFFTTDFTADVYTQEGLDWIAASDFRAVIGRTIPALNKTVYGVDNAFKPWKVASRS